MVERYQQRMAGEDTPPMYETVLLRSDGSKVYVEINAGVIAYLGKPADLVMVRDVTKRKRAEEELENARTTLEAAFEQTPIPMVLVSMPDAVLRIANSAYREILGIMDEPEVVGQRLVDFKPPYLDYDAQGKLTSLTEAPLALALQGKRTLNQERRIVTKDGTTHWALVSGNPIYNTHGDPHRRLPCFPRYHRGQADRRSTTAKRRKI